MKKSWLILTLVLFSFSFVNAASDCTIQSSCSAGKYEVSNLGFYSNSNTHAGFGINDYVLCCDYDGMSFVEVEVISPNYNFLMFNTLNSHLAFEANQYWFDSGYNTKVDIDGVLCSSISSGSCPIGGNNFCLFSASAGGNAHVSSCSDPNYGWKMCCEYSSPYTGCFIDDDCDDSNVCTTDVCNGGTCEYTYNTNGCDDSNSCTSGDTCSAGSCDGTPITTCISITNDGCCPGSCTYINDIDCASPAPGPAPIVGPDEYIVYGSCEDDDDGDQYGTSNWTLYDGGGNVLNTSNSLCILYSSDAPFLSVIGILLFFVLIFGFYFKESYLNPNQINKKRGEKICK